MFHESDGLDPVGAHDLDERKCSSYGIEDHVEIDMGYQDRLHAFPVHDDPPPPPRLGLKHDSTFSAVGLARGAGSDQCVASSHVLAGKRESESEQREVVSVGREGRLGLLSGQSAVLAREEATGVLHVTHASEGHVAILAVGRLLLRGYVALEEEFNPFHLCSSCCMNDDVF